MTRVRRYASGPSWRAVALVVIMLATVAVALVVALEQPGTPRPLGPPVTVDERATRDPSPSTRTRRPQRSRTNSRGERRRSAAPRGDETGPREHISDTGSGLGGDDQPRTTPPQASAPSPSSGASPVRSPSAPAAGPDDDDEADDDEADEADEDDPDGPGE
jgi:hypothetical protein